MPKRKESAAEHEVQEVELNRKHERLRQRDIEQHRRLYLGVGIAVALAVVFMAIGLVNEFALAPRRTVATVGDVKIVASEFGQRVKMEQSDLTNALRMYALQEQQFGNQGIFTSQINQLQATLASPFALGQQTLDRMIREIIVGREAAARGISVSDQEIDDALREEVASGLGLVTAPQATATAEAGVSATATATLWTPTPEPTADISVSAGITGSEGISGTEGITGTAGITGTEGVTATATPFPTPEPARVITDTGYTDGLALLEANLKTYGGMTIAEYREIVRSRLLSDKLAAAIGEEDVAATEDAVEARHILVSEIAPTPTPTEIPAGDPTPEPTATATALPEGAPTPTATPAPRDREQALALATELRGRIVDGGEDFATLAQEYSDDLGSGANGGDLGWFARGAMVAPFDEAAFSLPIGEVSEPISTTFGYHLIEVTQKDAERAKDESTLEQERSTAFNDWLTAQIAAANVQRGDVTASLPRDMR